MGGIFGNMFDMNRDGKMDAFERAMELRDIIFELKSKN